MFLGNVGTRCVQSHNPAYGIMVAHKPTEYNMFTQDLKSHSSSNLSDLRCTKHSEKVIIYNYTAILHYST